MNLNIDMSARGKMTPAQLASWLKRASTGEAVEYYRGDLAHDRQDDKSTSGARRAVNQIDDAAWDSGAHGRVHLVQQRLAPFVFSYLAIRRKTA